MRPLLFILSLPFLLYAGQPPFQRGVNLTNWFQAESAGQIPFGKYTKTDFVNIKSLGCDVIRLPISLHAMTSGAPDYIPDPVFLHFIDQAADWAEETGIYLILDDHTFDPAVDTPDDIDQALLPVWRQMAEHFKNRSDLIMYEILNEPHGISDARWNEIQQQVVSAIREIDPVHTIIVGPAGWNSYHNLQYMPEYTDQNLIYTWHFYEPFLFTHQGASWTNPSMVPLGGVPFPYDQAEMPETPDELLGTWIEWEMTNYPNTGTVEYIRGQLDIAFNFSVSRNVPVFCGEMGVYIPNSDPQDRMDWYFQTRLWLDLRNMAWTMWDYHGGFGLFEEDRPGWFEYDLNTGLAEALGFTWPNQKTYIPRPDSAGIDIYSDFTAQGIGQENWLSSGQVDYYSAVDPADGLFCLHWQGAGQYNSIRFNFSPDKDLSVLEANGYQLAFGAKAESGLPDFDVRFLDTKTDIPEDHPWRMGLTLDNVLLPRDGQWHSIVIPLSDLVEKGSWDNNNWYDAQGLFEWENVDYLEFTAEHGAFGASGLYLDRIVIEEPFISVDKSDSRPVGEMRLAGNFPNPFNPATNIRFFLPQSGKVTLKIYSLNGGEVTTLLNETRPAGLNQVRWNGLDRSGNAAASGVYFYGLEAEGKKLTGKMLLIR